MATTPGRPAAPGAPRPAGPAGAPGAPGAPRGPQANPFATGAGGAPGAAVDDEFELDATDVEEGGGFFTPPAGWHYGFVKDLEKTLSKKNNDQFQWDFTIVTPESPAYGKDFRQWTSLTPAARWVVCNYLDALGFQTRGQLVRFRRSDVLLKPVMFEITHEKYIDNNNVERTRANIDPSNIVAPNEECIAAVQAYLKSTGQLP